MYKKLKEKVYNLIRDDDSNSTASWIFDGVIITLIIINIALVIADTFNMPAWYTKFSSVVETASSIAFTVEYLLRMWVSDIEYSDSNPFVARIRYFFSFLALIDLFAILPFYLPFFLGGEMRVLKAIRLIRVFRIFKFGRYTGAMQIIGTVFKRKSHQLVSSMVVIFILMVIASVLIYNVENKAQPDVFQNAFSGLWWAVATFTTVGYGDIFPITALGKILSALIAMLGIGLVAVPTGIISAGFIELSEKKEKEIESSAEEKKFCPYCGHEYEK